MKSGWNWFGVILEHCFIWLRDLDTMTIGSNAFGEIWNVVLEKKGEDEMVRESNYWRSSWTYRKEEDTSKYLTYKILLDFQKTVEGWFRLHINQMVGVGYLYKIFKLKLYKKCLHRVLPRIGIEPWWDWKGVTLKLFEKTNVNI